MDILQSATTLVAVLFGGAISAGVSWLQANRQSRAALATTAKQAEYSQQLAVTQAELAKQVATHQAELASSKARAQSQRDDLEKRLSLQRDALHEYLALAARHQVRDKSPSRSLGVASTKDNSEAHRDAVIAYGKLLVAFGSEAFAHQAADAIEMIGASSGHPLLEAISTSLIATPLINQMIAATRATEEQLGLPKPALVPTPNIPPDEYTRERKRAYLRDIVQKSGHDPAKVDQILDEVYKRNAAEAGKK